MAIIDEEFGEITIRRSKLARAIKISVAPNGKLRVSAPFYVPESSIKRLIKRNRPELGQMLNERNSKNIYKNNQPIGKSHTLIFKKNSSNEVVTKIENQYIVVYIPKNTPSDSVEVQSEIRSCVSKVLRKQAKAYLTRRIDFLSKAHGFKYDRVRFSHASTLWGSCSTSGTISLNITLMNLPHRLIDYIIIHELCHTREMNHSAKFWSEVEKYDPEYRKHVKEMKKYNPNI